MANERLWDSIGPIAFIADGADDGVVTLTSTFGLRVKQQVAVYSTTIPINKAIKLEIKKVLSPTKVIIGKVETVGQFMNRYPMSAYLVSDGAMLKVVEQERKSPRPEDILKAIYEQEPVVALRTYGVDAYGEPWSSQNPMPISGTFVGTSDLATIQRIQNIDIVLADTEYPVTFPANTKRYQIRIRDHACAGNLAFIPGETGTNFWQITRGAIIDSHDMNLPTNSTLYISLHKPNMVLEVIAWIKQ